MSSESLRMRWLTRPIFGWARGALPSMSATEKAAIEAGEVWWDAELFTGNPDWKKLLGTPPARLSDREQAFLDGPVRDLCAIVDDWKVTWEDGDLPPEAWEMMRKQKFFGMIIPQGYGGLDFSSYAQSEVIRMLSTRSITAAVTVMVPNSLGPGELLMMFGTQEQRDHWLPRLADGREIPCFGLTSREAGSDAAAMIDTGVVCRGEFEGKETLGIRLNFRKRYITLSPVATVLGLAFKLHDPDGLLGGDKDRGITVALVPTDLPGVKRGCRHLPGLQFFQNGPIEGEDVFIPLDNVIGGQEQVGKGWPMLMSALAAGRGISLPSLSAAGAAFCARTTGAYARVRTQFGLPVGRFEGVKDRMGRLAGNAYLLDAARRLTCAGIDEGRAPAVVSAIMKAHATYRMRDSVIEAMDVHSGKTVIDGPRNYLGSLWRAIPIGITVEGANILTRNLIIFGQGSIRCHPYLLKEMTALEETDKDKALKDFDKAFWGHVGHATATFFRAWGRSLTGGLLAPAPADAGAVTKYYRQLSRYAACFALTSDMALLTLGGALKRKETISARLGDILSELYLLSAVLKRWQDEGRKDEDLPLVAWCMEEGMATIETSFDQVLANFPSRVTAWFLRLFMPMGRRRGPSDALTQACADILMEPSATRDRLTAGLYLGGEGDSIHALERAFALVVETEPIRRKLRDARIDPADPKAKTLITADETRRLAEAKAAVDEVIEVDDFPADELSGAQPKSAKPQAGKAPARRKTAPRKTAGSTGSSKSKPKSSRATPGSKVAAE
ncbi:acyl-CoA dehydrogenase [Microbaculum marinum]|uniref:Acyl-coenzyme A dehydrogenase n=1 Tax=Microbaculum marinum TaxID=1764581 RepID=A0AAW9RLA4_9HYPH